MKIALDAMGGDYAPVVTVNGAIEAVEAFGVEVALVGDEEKVGRELERAKEEKKRLPPGLSVVHASQVVPMDEHRPADALRKYRDSSVVVATELVAKGEADAVVSAGNTGAAMAAALLRLKRIEGVERPAIGTVYPTVSGNTFLIDAGANVDCRPHHLLCFAVMGSAYAERVLGVRNPRVALLSIGEEEGKGNELVFAAHQLLKEGNVNFVGNIEGKDIPFGVADVVVTDGFAGNVVLKLSEGLGQAIFSMFKAGVETNLAAKIGALLMRPVLSLMKKRMDYAEYGGAPLLGVNGVSIIAHGRSDAKAIRNSIKAAHDAVANDIVGAIRHGLARHTHADGCR
ncbi:MAG TPA: phosphate acyltransferase PlsX [Firmicutes bacterium]|nr:phosphate acyltransferase PlsX [Bacillota bacterium]